MSEYGITLLSVQSWEYRDRRKPEIGQYRIILLNDSNSSIYAKYHRQHCTLQAFEQFGALYMHNLDDKYQTRLGFELWIPSHNWIEWANGPCSFPKTLIIG